MNVVTVDVEELFSSITLYFAFSREIKDIGCLRKSLRVESFLLEVKQLSIHSHFHLIIAVFYNFSGSLMFKPNMNWPGAVCINIYSNVSSVPAPVNGLLL